MRQKMVKYVQLILLEPIHVYACYIHAHASYITEQQRISIVDKNDSCGKESEETYNFEAPDISITKDG